ncbi:STAS domain-containing protein [Streptomyces sp. NPDC003697]
MFRVEVARDVPVLALRGEPDFESVVRFDEAAGTSLAGGGAAPSVVVGSSVLAFCASSGIGVLVRLYQRPARDGTVLRVAAAPLSVRRVFALTGLDQAIAVRPPVDAALAWPVPDAVPATAADVVARPRAVGEERRRT